MTARKRCKGINKHGKHCGNWIEGESNFCIWHEQSEEDRSVVIRLLEKSKNNLPAFIAGALGEAFIGDVYNILKEAIFSYQKETDLNLDLQSLLINRARRPYFQKLMAHPEVMIISNEFKRWHTPNCLDNLVLLLSPGLERDEIIQLLGKGAAREGTNENDAQYSYATRTPKNLLPLHLGFTKGRLDRISYQFFQSPDLDWRDRVMRSIYKGN